MALFFSLAFVWVYLSETDTLECPKISCTVLISAPYSAHKDIWF